MVKQVSVGDTGLVLLDDSCPICLETMEDPVMMIGCYHVYCFECLSTWAHSLARHGVQSPTCPLCKMPFHDVYADLRSETDFDVINFHRGRVIDRRKRSDSRREQLRRRSLVYQRRLQLVCVADKVVDEQVFPKPHKIKGEYEEWLKRELRACIGREIDLTLLSTIVSNSFDNIAKYGTAEFYQELIDTLTPFLLNDTKIFVRELAFFMGSRLNMDTYDRVAEYSVSNPGHGDNPSHDFQEGACQIYNASVI